MLLLIKGETTPDRVELTQR